MEANNMAATRKALENLTRFTEVDIRGLENLAKYAIDHSMYGGGVLQAVAGAIREGKKALSAPARNCDRPECATSKDAQNVWRKEDGGKTPYYEWLLAPAEKGGEE